jgi:hypothetical protein
VHPGGRAVGVIPEFLRDPPGTARITVRIEGRRDGQPELACAVLITSL